jgi:hypothetical protein
MRRLQTEKPFLNEIVAAGKLKVVGGTGTVVMP